jgi:GT2 family glycosyltransferase
VAQKVDFAVSRDVFARAPAVSVVVLTYGRRDELVRTLASVERQSWPGLEVIVVSNNGDDTSQWLAVAFPRVRVIETGKNIGTAARNLGVKAAHGEIVLTLDNDVHLVGEDFVSRLVAFFSAHPASGCAVFRVLTPEGILSGRDWCHPREAAEWAEQPFETTHISEGASAFRKNVFEEVGGYDPDFFIGHEGLDLWARLHKAGYPVWYAPTLSVLHFASQTARPGERAFYYNTRNNLLLAHAHYPLGRMLRYAGVYTAMMLFYALRERRVGAFCRGVRDGVRMARVRRRRAFDGSQTARLGQLWRYKPSLLARVRKHLAMRQGYR